MSAIGLIAIGAGIAVLAGLGAGLGMGIATSKAVEAVGTRQDQLRSFVRVGFGGIHRNLRFCSCAVDHVCVRR